MAPVHPLDAVDAGVTSNLYTSGAAAPDGAQASLAQVAGAVKELDDRLLLNRRQLMNEDGLGEAAIRLVRVIQTTDAAQPAWAQAMEARINAGAQAMEARIKASGTNAVVRCRNQLRLGDLSNTVYKLVKEKEGLGDSLPSTSAQHRWTPAPGAAVPSVGDTIGPDITWGQLRDLQFADVDRYARLFNNNFGITEEGLTLKARVRALESFFIGSG